MRWFNLNNREKLRVKPKPDKNGDFRVQIIDEDGTVLFLKSGRSINDEKDARVFAARIAAARIVLDVSDVE